MNIVFYDPAGPKQHQYVTQMYFQPLRDWMKSCGIKFRELEAGDTTTRSTVIINADYLTEDTIENIKSDGNKIVGFSCTDSSYVSQACRSGRHLQQVDLMFMLTGLQKINTGYEMILDKDLNVKLEKRQFLPDEDWAVFDSMRQTGRLQSLPYIHWTRQEEIPPQPYSLRSQKALIRGGHHMRRFLLALELMAVDKLDINSGFVTSPYFRDDMNPQFRYCDGCRDVWKMNGRYPWSNHTRAECANQFARQFPPDLSDLGAWNNKCPQSFYDAAHAIGNPDPTKLMLLLNAQWLTQRAHSEMLARITFTADLKWLFSIYAAQRFWDAAMTGCINLLPSRTADQEYFPKMNPEEHYWTFTEDLKELDWQAVIGEREYDCISKNARALFGEWIKPTDYALNTNILKRIFSKIEEFAS